MLCLTGFVYVGGVLRGPYVDCVRTALIPRKSRAVFICLFRESYRIAEKVDCRMFRLSMRELI